MNGVIGLQTKCEIIPFLNKFMQTSSSSVGSRPNIQLYPFQTSSDNKASSVGIVNFLTIKQLLDSNLQVEHNNSELFSYILYFIMSILTLFCHCSTLESVCL